MKHLEDEIEFGLLENLFVREAKVDFIAFSAKRKHQTAIFCIIKIVCVFFLFLVSCENGDQIYENIKFC